MARLRYFLRQALLALGRSLGVTFLAVVTIGVSLAVLSTFAIVVDNLKRIASELGREVDVTVYLSRDLGAEAGESMAKTLEASEEVETARFLTSGRALEEFRTSLDEDAVLLEGLPEDVLPPSIELELVGRTWTREETEALGKSLRAKEGVEDVRFGQEEVDRVYAMLGFARVAALVLGLALSLATILIISNTIRLTVYARRDEIEIMSLVGATGSFVRAPFILEGAIQGFIGGLIALGLLAALEGVLEVALERGLGLAYVPVDLDVAPFELLAFLLICGTVLGLLGSLLAVGKFLRS